MSGAGFDYGALVGSIGDEITRWHDLTEQKQAFIASDPCAGAVAFAELSANWIGPLVDEVAGATATLSSSLHSALRSSILNQGEPTAGVVGGESLADFVLSQASPTPLVPPHVVFGGPIAASLYMQGLIPGGSDLLNNRVSGWSANAGAPILGVGGLYLSSNGKLTGSTMAQWVQDWMVGQLGASGPAPALFPAARAMLENLTGSATGSLRVGAWLPGVWQPSDGYAANSRGGRLTFVLSDAMKTMEELETICTGGRITGDLRETLRTLLPFAALLTVAWVWKK